MTNTLNFRDFYPKRPIAAILDDLDFLRAEAGRTAQPATDPEPFTHWMIGLEGCETGSSNLSWRVKVFPLLQSGQYFYGAPYYRSPEMRSFQEAADLAITLETEAKLGQLAKMNS